MQRDVKKEFLALQGTRNEPLERARNNSAYTVPSLMPEEGHNETTRLPEPWQSLGARGVNNIASRIILTLFPPNTANWRGSIASATAAEQGMSDEERGEFDSALSGFEQEYRRNFEASGDRSTLFEIIRMHLTTGDVLARMLPKGKLRYYRLDQFGVQRDLDGNILKIIVCESVAYKALPEDIRSKIGPKDQQGAERKDVKVFTVIERIDGQRFKEAQYVEGMMVEGTDAEHPTELKMPWRVIRYTEIPGENHGRAFVDDVLPDLKSLDSLTQSVVEGIAIAVKTIMFVKPGSAVNRQKLQKAQNGDVLSGNAADISVLRIEKQADLSVALQMIDRLETRLGFQFLLNSAVQRQGERVTAAEIRLMAQELEASLGGFYSKLASDLQFWYVNQRIAVMERMKLAPKLPRDIVDIQIITGIDALGRNAELDALDQFLLGAAEFMGQNLAKVINFNDYLRRRAAALGIDTRNLVKTEEQTQAQTDDEQVQGAVAAAAPGVIQQAAQGVAQQEIPE